MSGPGLPLAGIRVADFTWVGAGPYATKQLAEYGADVVKVESTVKTDELRHLRPMKDGVAGVNRSGYFASRNPAKRSICLDLRDPRGHDLALRLVARSDVVANNFASGVMQRLGLGYDAVREVNPRAIYLTMPMIGDVGPQSSFRGYGVMLSGMSGFLGLSGHLDGAPTGTGTNYPDHVPNPLHAATAVLAALRHRDLTGSGQHVELAQLESTINAIGGSVLQTSLTGEPPVRQGNDDDTAFPHGLFRCAGEDQWCAIAVLDDAQWVALADCLDAAELRVPQWRTQPGRRAAAESVLDALERQTVRLDPWTLAARLCAAGVPASAVADARDVAGHDEQLRERRHYAILPHVEMGACLYDRSPARLSGTPVELRTAAPLLGEHTREVAVDLLGLSPATFDRWAAEGVFR